MSSLTSHRWWAYQAERFPLVAHGPLVIVFCLSVLLFSSLQSDAIPSLSRIAAAAASALLFFLQLRIADEHESGPVGRVAKRLETGIVGVGPEPTFRLSKGFHLRHRFPFSTVTFAGVRSRKVFVESSHENSGCLVVYIP